MPSEAEIIRLWAARGLLLLQQHISELNALNVFPVADADTGTNLFLSFQSAQVAELSRSGDINDVKDAVSALAQGALEGARGNSGVILAAALMGALEAFSNAKPSLSTILQHAAIKARESVLDPQPGTILTILDFISQLDSDNPRVIAERARSVLLQTRDLLPQLKEAGVVDAGGRGLVILLDALTQVCEGVESESPSIGFIPTESPLRECFADREFEVLFKTSSTDVKGMQLRLQAYGTSITTTSDGVMMNVHVHTDVPKAVLSDIEQDFRVWDIKIESLQSKKSAVGCVAITEGTGNVMHLVSLGILALSDSERKPNTVDVVQAVLKTDCSDVIILASSTYADIASEANKELREFNVTLRHLETPSIVSTVAAVSVFEKDSDIETNYNAMGRAINGIDSISLENSDFTVLPTQQLKNAELITVIWGASADSSYQTGLLKHMRAEAPYAEIIEITGDQDSSMAQVGLE